jgi:hypothetical protein
MHTPAEAPRGARHPALRLAGFALAAAAAGLLLALAIPRLDDAGRRPPADTSTSPPRAVFPTWSFPAPPDRDRRIPLYLVASEADRLLVERALVASSYIELNNGDFVGPWAIIVMTEAIGLRDIELLNLARIAGGELPYRVIDIR